MPQRPQYDCDTSSYWCSEDDYHRPDRSFGKFIEDGAAYEIMDRNTPRPWLNYLCNDRYGCVISNTGLGFGWYKSVLLRVTRYAHPVDYLPREFEDGRRVRVRDIESGEEWDAFQDAQNVRCVHRPGTTMLQATCNGIEVTMTVFVPLADAAECWQVRIRNTGKQKANLEVSCGQTWVFARFGFHTAEEGIPYVSTPGRNMQILAHGNTATAFTADNDLPCPLGGVFSSPQASGAAIEPQEHTHRDGRTFVFHACRLQHGFKLEPEEESRFYVLAGVGESEGELAALAEKYTQPDVFEREQAKVAEHWQQLLAAPCCEIPDKNIERFLNTWLKNQLSLTLRYVRSGLVGYRDCLQDAWGYTLIEPKQARAHILQALSHMRPDGSCPRQYSQLDNNHDLRRFMDSGTWIAMALTDLIAETGEFELLDTPLPYLDSHLQESVREHVWKAMDLLFSQRGAHGLCLTGDGDWNDALEGISKCGDAESAWLTMALLHAQNLMAGLCDHTGDTDRAEKMRRRSAELRDALQEHAWDGDWFVYGFTGTGKPIGSKRNREGRIHLNAQTWAMLSGLADAEQVRRMRAAIDEHLETPVGPALLAPPYVEEAAEVGRIARLEPGTFENGSVYQHAVTFKVLADVITGNPEAAVDTFRRILPTNPENPDPRRTSEPYAMGNYYCGPGHERFGQNFFTWFTGNPAWLLRIGFDWILGVRATYNGLLIEPGIPAGWNHFRVTRIFRNTRYDLDFARVTKDAERGILVDGQKLEGNLIPPCARKQVEVRVTFGQ